jgi:hypothetical protein
LYERISRAQSKEIGTGIGRVQEAEAIFAVAYLKVWLVNTIDEDLVTSYTIRVKHIGSLVVCVEFSVSDCKREVKGAGGKCRRISRVIYNVHAGETHPDVPTRDIHTVIVVKLHLPALIAASFEAIIDIGARASRWDEKIHWLAIVHRRRVVAVVMHS